MKTRQDYTDGVFSISNITKSMAWDLQENDVIRLWQAAEKEVNIQECGSRYMDIIRTAFEVEELKIDKPEIIKKYVKVFAVMKALKRLFRSMRE